MDAQQQVAKNIADRGYRKGWTAEQFAARQVCKMVEELGELASHVRVGTSGVTPWWLQDVKHAAQMCREAFDEFDHWEHATIDANGAMNETPDAQVVVFNLSEALAEITGEPFDVVQAAVDKSAADVERGVR